MNSEKLYKIFIKECKGKICTDTRAIVLESLFFALSGENYDGNKYAEQALELGCKYVVIDNYSYVRNEKYILVEDTAQTLVELAYYHRIQFNIPVIGITGSNGKTTTKELIATTLQTEKKITMTQGNLNNHIGVPLTLLTISDDTEIAIVEMGANHVGEIAFLCEIAKPTHGIITNIGRSHLGEFGGFDNVIRSKTELYRYLKNHQGTSFVNGLDEILLRASNTLEKITYLSKDSDYIISSKKTSPYVSLLWNNTLIKSHLSGEYNTMNIAAAIAIADYFGIDELNIKKGIESYLPKNNRSEIVETKNGNTIIKDYYNANRSSMELAIENIANIKTDKEKVLILGDMFELGEYEKEEHFAVVNKIAEYNCFDKVFLVGKAFSGLDISLQNFEQYKTTDEVIFALQKSPLQNSYILIKASNGMNFKSLFDILK